MTNFVKVGVFLPIFSSIFRVVGAGNPQLSYVDPVRSAHEDRHLILIYVVFCSFLVWLILVGCYLDHYYRCGVVRTGLLYVAYVCKRLFVCVYSQYVRVRGTLSTLVADYQVQYLSVPDVSSSEDWRTSLPEVNLPIRVMAQYLDSWKHFSEYCETNGLYKDLWWTGSGMDIDGGVCCVVPKLFSDKWNGYNVDFLDEQFHFVGKNDSFYLPNPFYHSSWHVVWSDDLFMYLEVCQPIHDCTKVTGSLSGSSVSVFDDDYTWAGYVFPWFWKFLYALFKVTVDRLVVRIVILGNNVLLYKYVGNKMTQFHLAHTKALAALLADFSAQRFLGGDFGKLATICKRHLVNCFANKQEDIMQYMYGTLYCGLVLSLLLNGFMYANLGDLKMLAYENNKLFDDWASSAYHRRYFSTRACCILILFLFLLLFVFSYFCFFFSFSFLFWVLVLTFVFVPSFLFLAHQFIVARKHSFSAGVLITTVKEKCVPSQPKPMREHCSLEYIPGRCDDCRDGAYVYAPCRHEECTVASSCVHNGYTACIERNIAIFDVNQCPEDFSKWCSIVIDNTIVIDGDVKSIDERTWARRYNGHKRELYEEAIEDDENEGVDVLVSRTMEAFNKREIVFKLKAPRLIVGSKPSFSAKVGPKLYTSSSILKSAWGGSACPYANVQPFPGLYYTAGMNKNALGALYDEMIAIFGDDCSVGNFDFSKYDAHLQECHLESERLFYKHVFGYYSDAELKSFFSGLDGQMTRTGVIKCRDGTLKCKIHAARKSGDQNTSVGNSFLNVCFHTYVLNSFGIDVFKEMKARRLAIWVMGDDCLVWLHKSIRPPPVQEYVAKMKTLGMEIKGDWYYPRDIDYCSNLFIPALEGTVATQFLGRNICKAYISLHKYGQEKSRYWTKQVSMAYRQDFSHVPFMYNYHNRIYQECKSAKHVRIQVDSYDGKHVEHASTFHADRFNQFMMDRYGVDAKECERLASLHPHEFIADPVVDRFVDVDVRESSDYGTKKPRPLDYIVVNDLGVAAHAINIKDYKLTNVRLRAVSVQPKVEEQRPLIKEAHVGPPTHKFINKFKRSVKDALEMGSSSPLKNKPNKYYKNQRRNKGQA